MVIGGEPIDEHIVMWWNFVGRDHEDIVTAWDDWVRADTRFGTVHGYHGDRLPAPPLLVVRLVAARGGEGAQRPGHAAEKRDAGHRRPHPHRPTRPPPTMIRMADAATVTQTLCDEPAT